MSSIAKLKEINARRAESRKKTTKTVQAEKDKTPVECGCGSTYKKYIKSQHESTTKHIEWLETQNTVVTPEPIPESDDDIQTEETDTYIDDLARAEAKISELCICLNMINNRMKALYELVDVDRPMMEQSAKKMFDMFALVLQMKRLGQQLMVEYTSK